MAEALATYVRHDRVDATCRVVDGEIDLDNIGAFGEQLWALVDDAHSPAVVDLRMVTFFGAVALGARVEAHRHATARGVQLVVVPSDAVRRILELTDLDTRFELR